MNNEHTDTKKIITGLLIGAVGAGALYCIYASKHKKTPFLKKVGRTIADVGEMIENCNLDTVTESVESVQQKLPQGAEMLNTLNEWVSTGVSLWKKFSQ